MVMKLFTATPTVGDVNTSTMQTFKQFLESSEMHDFVREKWLHLFLWEGHRNRNSATAFQPNANKAFVECSKLLNKFLNDMQEHQDADVPTWVIRWALIALDKSFEDPTNKNWQTFVYRELGERMIQDEVWFEE